MSWFLFAVVCLAGWGLADLFYKKGSNSDDRNSHLKIAVWVGLVMGVCAVFLLPLSESHMVTKDGLQIKQILVNIYKYSPASLGYILSMIIGYAGLRYLELSIVSPVQNASGALSTIVMIVYFVAIGQVKKIGDTFSALDIIGTVIIVAAIIALAFVEKNLAQKERELSPEMSKKDRKYTYGALALIFPILYCVFDTIGTAADGIILDESAGLGLGEIDVIILYGFTFFAAAVVCFIVLWIKEKKPYNPFRLKSEWPKMTAALAEEAGQVFYVYAMAKNPMLAAPVVASYCIVSMILSRIFLKEKLQKSQLICVILVVVGIVCLGISEGLAEG